MFFDERFDDEREAQTKEWGNLVCDTIPDICALAGKYRDNVAGSYAGFHRGTFNLSLRLHWDDDKPDWVVRFPIPGKAFFAEEKVRNEVALMEYLRRNTSIPVPEIIAHGTAEECPARLGAFMIMPCVEGVRMMDLLKDETVAIGEGPRLNPDIDEETLGKIYGEVSKVLLEMWFLDFDSIGSFDFDKESNTLQIQRAPITIGGTELVRYGGFPEKHPFSKAFSSSLDYFTALADLHVKQLKDQLNSVNDSRDCRQKYTSRHLFKSIVPFFTSKSDNNGPFKLFCDDLTPGNILVDPSTLKITAVIDWEFTYAAPAQFAASPPAWLLVKNIEDCVEDAGLEKFLENYKPKFELFIRALEAAEAERYSSNDPYNSDAGKKLSTRMRQSLEDRTVWFNIALRNGWGVDPLYWDLLDDYVYGEASITERVARATGEVDFHRDRESFVRSKIEDVKRYNAEVEIEERIEYEEPKKGEKPGYWMKSVGKDAGTQTPTACPSLLWRRIVQAYAWPGTGFTVKLAVSTAIVAMGIALLGTFSR